MTDAEAQEVLRLHLRRTDGRPELSATDVAEAIRVPESEVRRLLAEVRQNKRLETAIAPVSQTKRRDSRMAMVAAILFLVAVWSFAEWRIELRNAHRENLAPPTALMGNGYVVQIGEQTGFVATGIAATNAFMNQDLVQLIDREVVANTLGQQVPLGNENQVLASLKSGKWDVPGMRFVPLRLHVNGAREQLSDESFTMPIYDGEDAQIQQRVDQERQTRIRESLKNIARVARVMDAK